MERALLATMNATTRLPMRRLNSAYVFKSLPDSPRDIEDCGAGVHLLPLGGTANCTRRGGGRHKSGGRGGGRAAAGAAVGAAVGAAAPAEAALRPRRQAEGKVAAGCRGEQIEGQTLKRT